MKKKTNDNVLLVMSTYGIENKIDLITCVSFYVYFNYFGFFESEIFSPVLSGHEYNNYKA